MPEEVRKKLHTASKQRYWSSQICEFLFPQTCAQTLFLKKEGRGSRGMKPSVLRYFCMRVLFHLARNSGYARQRERVLKWSHNSSNHKHSHSHFAHKPNFFNVCVHAWNTFHVHTFLIQVSDCESPPRVPSSLSAPSISKQNTIKSHCRSRMNRAVYWEQFTALKEMSETGADPESLY